jgi:hypothetical protein
MIKFPVLPALISLSLIVACNSNSNSNDAANAGDTSTTKSADTSHGNMNMSSVQPVPDIPTGARVYFKNLKDGQTVSSPVKVEMGADNIKVDSAGTLRPGSGHHHILVDAAAIEAGQVIPKDSTHLHFGNAQKQAEVALKPGKHTLSLQFADGLHRSYGNKLSSTVTVTVKK